VSCSFTCREVTLAGADGRTVTGAVAGAATHVLARVALPITVAEVVARQLGFGMGSVIAMDITIAIRNGQCECNGQHNSNSKCGQCRHVAVNVPVGSVTIT
jgi:hypothetical protein